MIKAPTPDAASRARASWTRGSPRPTAAFARAGTGAGAGTTGLGAIACGSGDSVAAVAGTAGALSARWLARGAVAVTRDGTPAAEASAPNGAARFVSGKIGAAASFDGKQLRRRRTDSSPLRLTSTSFYARGLDQRDGADRRDRLAGMTTRPKREGYASEPEGRQGRSSTSSTLARRRAPRRDRSGACR